MKIKTNNMKTLTLILLLSFTAKAQKSMVLGIPMTKEQDLTFDYYSSLICTVSLSQFLDKVTHHKHPLMCRVISAGLNLGVPFLERGFDGKFIRFFAITNAFIIDICISNYKDNKIYEAEQLCKDLKNPIFFKDDIPMNIKLDTNIYFKGPIITPNYILPIKGTPNNFSVDSVQWKKIMQLMYNKTKCNDLKNPIFLRDSL